MRPGTREMLPRVFRSAFRYATSGRTGAVHISIPEDVLSGTTEFDERELYAESHCGSCPAFRSGPTRS
ncbi:MAG: thiamine pyrophosphate-binding protein [Bacillota bacterium]|nr:thiamine pyrophosphate-binding protein [Bacillota bacterium]